jgi:regulator of sigma E protease
MEQIILSLIGFIIAVMILVTVHELGHFLVARAFGIRVERFSIGFGRPLLRWHDKSGTEYMIASIPLGGYVSLFGEKSKPITGSERFEAFSYQSVWVRMAVLLAGPFANFLLAIVAFWLMFIIGISSMAPVLGQVPKGSLADSAGLHSHQEIVSIEGKPTHSWEAVTIALVDALGKEQTVTLQTQEFTKNSSSVVVTDDNKSMATHTLDFTGLEKGGEHGDILKELGLIPFNPYPIILGKISAETPAAKAGLQSGDQVVAVNGSHLSSAKELRDYIQSHVGKTIHLEIRRADKVRTINVQPDSKTVDDKEVGFIGVELVTEQTPPKEYLRTERFNVQHAFTHAVKHTWDYISLTFSLLKKMISGVVSVKHLSGPITIAHVAGKTVTIGFEYFLNFLAIISISLGVINLLPIPLLDGGHLFYCVCELITGRPVSEHVQYIGAWLGGALLLVVMLLAFYNDLVRLFFS